MFDNFSLLSSLMMSLMDVCCVKSGDWYWSFVLFFYPFGRHDISPFCARIMTCGLGTLYELFTLPCASGHKSLTDLDDNDSYRWFRASLPYVLQLLNYKIYKWLYVEELHIPCPPRHLSISHKNLWMAKK